ncbi:SEC14-like protein 2 isoform X3 [Pseudoliparis swirei]|uniref:SEC14-like protein 2 isoform X3 n=1 Tax=Pseudoliparis swirei TaxID=2059687 RepID=UPI0024BE69CE|nr:SEC14-like protein 2 isoform X3 [Pseudoliparis swirei]
MSGRVGDLSPKQAEILTEFRGRIQDVLAELPAQHDHYLLRWLRARSFNVQKSEAMIRKHLEFRRKMEVDSIITDWKPPEVIERYVSGGMCGFDREGSPIWYDVIGPLDPRGLLLSATKRDFLKTKIRHTEILHRECRRQSEKLGEVIEAVSLIYDCEGLGLKHVWKPAIETYGEVLTMFEENYPEGLKRVFLIKGNWQEVLRNHIDPDQLPVAYGGTRTDPDGDPHCRSMIKYGGVVPASFYLRDSVLVQYDSSVKVSRGSAFQLEVEVTEAGSLLRCQFCSDGADVGFGVFRRPGDVAPGQKVSDMVPVLPSERYNAHLVPEDSQVTCPETGAYVLCFDNSYSILQSKKVSYKVEVLPPGDGPPPSPRGKGDRRLQ